jgi:hypothetical protein
MIDLHGDPAGQSPHDDLEINRAGDAAPVLTVKRTPAGVWIAGVLVVAAALIAWYIVARGPGRSGAQSASATSPPSTAPQPLPELGAKPADVTVPPLDDSDPVVRDLVRQLTSNPTVAAWLATDGLIRNFAVALSNVSDGISPERHLRVLRPSAPFAVIPQGDRLIIDPASYARYNNVAGAVGSIDADGAARLYATLKPRITEAYRDLGRPDTPVDQAVEQAIVSLLRTPIPGGPIVVQPGQRGIGYIFADPRLEALTSAQKQLLRMGPDNARTIQRSLRDIAIALGIPESRLPGPTTT